MSLTKKQRAALRDMFGGHCAYCGCVLPEKWHADHVEPCLRKSKIVYSDATDTYRYQHTGEFWSPESNRADNYFPACVACNIDKGPCTLEVWRAALQHSADVLRRNYATFRHAERFGLITANEPVVVFYFEKLRAQERAA